MAFFPCNLRAWKCELVASSPPLQVLLLYLLVHHRALQCTGGIETGWDRESSTLYPVKP